MTEGFPPESKPGAVYIHGTAPEEQARLTALNRLINERCLDALRLVPGHSILDVGSGLGQMTRAMARTASADSAGMDGAAADGAAAGIAAIGSAAIGSAAAGGPATRVLVLGIEASTEQMAEARRQAAADGESELVAFRSGDAMALPLTDAEWGSFDTAHTRFLLEHVTDPAAVVRAMARAVKPGGRLLLLDDDHDLLRLWPSVPGLTEVWQAYMRSYDRIGCDPFVGRRLVQLLHESGLEPARCEWVFFGACAGQHGFSGFVENLAQVLLGAREATADAGRVTGADVDRVVTELRRWGNRPDAAIWYAVALAEGRRPTQTTE